MPEYNSDRIKQIIGEINTSLKKLEKIKDLKENYFLSNSEKIDSAKYNLIVVTEGIIDIGNHIIAKEKARVPADYAETFDILVEIGLIPENLGENLKKMAKFRNLLVHLYWKIDDRKIYQIIKENLVDIKNFLKILLSYLNK
ncbi:DUF86 domain-containing protein [bacterium]|nr:DUF86 domain-containing protein [bacterium]